MCAHTSKRRPLDETIPSGHSSKCHSQKYSALRASSCRLCFLLVLIHVLLPCSDGFVISTLQQSKRSRERTSFILATVEGASSISSLVNPSNILDGMTDSKSKGEQYASQFDLQTPEASLYALMFTMRNIPLGLQGTPFVLRHDAIHESYGPTEWAGFFTMKHLQAAVEEDFLDAARGSTDNRKGWQVRSLS